MPAPPMDVFGIVYLIENAQQFWSELEEILNLPDGVTLDQLDATLRRFVTFCAAYHEQYLQSPLQLEHACDLLLASELFSFHSERMSEILLEDTRLVTDPHMQLMLYTILLAYGRRKISFLRSQKRWQPLIPLLMDNVQIDIEPDVEDTYAGSSSGGSKAFVVPIEAKLRSLSVRLLYEVCRVQKMSIQELEIFSDSFIDYLFDLVEQTRHLQDETFNYSIIKLIVALNEQFMVAALQPHPHGDSETNGGHIENKGENRVLRILMARQGSSMTFGENMIFMLNRADRTPEDLCMQLLVLKLLYLLFTTKGMAEYFYTNDLCVLVDVFLREIGNIDEDHESLRHTYLRVLHPLLTKTQLRDMPYKRAQIVRTLESLVENESIRDVDPTTKRLVQRCLSGEWCVQFRRTADLPRRTDSPALSVSPTSVSSITVSQAERSGSVRRKNPMARRSAENLLNPHANMSRRPTGRSIETLRQTSVDSTTSLPKVATAQVQPAGSASRRHDRTGSMEVDAATATFASLSMQDLHSGTSKSGHNSVPPRILVDKPVVSAEPVPDSPVSLTSSSSSISSAARSHRRAAPAPPVKRRKPPAIPTGRSHLDSSIVALSAASSQPSLTSLLPRRL